MIVSYDVLQEIYSSSKVKIEKVRASQNNQTYIQKTYIQNKNDGINALKILGQINNQFVLQVLEYFEDEEQRLVIIQEYCDQGDLKTFTYQHIGYKMQESIVWSLFLQMAYVLLNLNELGIQHRVLLPENILLLGRTEGYQIRVTDFHKASREVLCQTPCPAIYLPYETLFDGQYTQKSHIWQVGHILYFMVTQQFLFPITSLESQVKEQLRSRRVSINIPSQYSQSLINVINICLTIRESSRPNILQLLRMKEVREALDKPYYVFSLDQKRHLMYWINSKETTITKSVLYSLNDFDLHSPKMIQKDINVKKTFKNDRLPQIYSKDRSSQQQKTQKCTSSERPGSELFKEKLAQTMSTKRINYMGYTQKHFVGIVKPIHYHKKHPKNLQTQTDSLAKFTLTYDKKLDSEFQNLIDSKKSLCSTLIGDGDFKFLRSQIKANKSGKLLNYVNVRYPNLDSSAIIQQINDIAELEDQKESTNKKIYYN